MVRCTAVHHSSHHTPFQAFSSTTHTNLVATTPDGRKVYFRDEPAQFGARIVSPGIKGYIQLAQPNVYACSALTLAPPLDAYNHTSSAKDLLRERHNHSTHKVRVRGVARCCLLAQRSMGF